MQIFRHRVRSDEVLAGEDLFLGRVVFIEGQRGREERVFTSAGLLTQEEWRKFKQERASRNRARFGDKSRKPSASNGRLERPYFSSL